MFVSCLWYLTWATTRIHITSLTRLVTSILVLDLLSVYHYELTTITYNLTIIIYKLLPIYTRFTSLILVLAIGIISYHCAPTYLVMVCKFWHIHVLGTSISVLI